MVGCEFSVEIALWISSLSSPLQARLSWRLAPLMMGLLFATGRRTVASWLRAAGLGDDYKAYYYFLGSLGRKVDESAWRLLRLVRDKLIVDGAFLFGIDDSPTKRYGPCVEGAGIHHNPTPGPADSKFLYGHVWVTLCGLARHPQWGTIALPLLARLYVRVCDVGKLAPWYQWTFRTKLEQAAELVEWVAHWLGWLEIPIRVVADGFYAKRPFLKRAEAAGVAVISRLRKDAALFDLPPQLQRRGRGRPRKYGRNKLSLAKRAGQPQGWKTGEFHLYGKTVFKQYKTFLATYRPAGGVIRVVIVKNDDGTCTAFFSTDPELSVAVILHAVADRMTQPELTIADAIRHVTAAVQNAIDAGHRSRSIDADDLVEVLLAIADRLDPPIPGNLVDEDDACTNCGQREVDRLVWQDDDLVRCTTCGTTYRPGG